MFLEVLIGQMGQDGEIDVVLGKTLAVLGHAELFEPVPDLLHCGAASHSPSGEHIRLRGCRPFRLRRSATGNGRAGVSLSPRFPRRLDRRWYCVEISLSGRPSRPARAAHARVPGPTAVMRKPSALQARSGMESDRWVAWGLSLPCRGDKDYASYGHSRHCASARRCDPGWRRARAKPRSAWQADRRAHARRPVSRLGPGRSVDPRGDRPPTPAA